MGVTFMQYRSDWSVNLIIDGQFEYFMEGKQEEQTLELRPGLESVHG